MTLSVWLCGLNFCRGVDILVSDDVTRDLMICPTNSHHNDAEMIYQVLQLVLVTIKSISHTFTYYITMHLHSKLPHKFH